MIDAGKREKAIRGLECCVDTEVPCRECPYYNYGHCDPDDARRDALALLREQEPVKAKILKNAITINYKKYAFYGMCPVCNSLLLRHWVACPTCGKAVKWE